MLIENRALNSRGYLKAWGTELPHTFALCPPSLFIFQKDCFCFLQLPCILTRVSFTINVTPLAANSAHLGVAVHEACSVVIKLWLLLQPVPHHKVTTKRTQ